MDSAVEIESERVGEKRLAEGDGPPAKSIKGGGLVGDVKKVAETVLVLAAMGKIRGGQGPTEFEKNSMAKARERLAKVCAGFAPKDVFPSDAFGGMIEDLGLNKLKERRLGFRPPKISIAEKLMLSKRKMVKSSDFSVPSVPHSSQLMQMNSGAAGEIHGTLHTVRMPQSDKSSHVPISSGSFQSASPFGHATPAGSSLSYQLPTSEIRPMLPSALPSSHSTALPRVERQHLRSDGRPSDSSSSSQVKANYSANSAYGTPTWSVQPQFVSAAKSGTDNKVPVNMSVRVEGAAASRSVVNQNTTTLLSTHDLKGMNFQAPSIVNGHADICKIVQKLLHPSAAEHSTWNPPSTDYMNKTLTCQMCMYTLAEIDNMLVCDCCEKGFHIKCLRTTTHKGVPRGEWHCGKCLSISNGKPFPPKYGRVMRNTNAPKLASNAAAVPSSSNKKVEASGKSVSQSKLVANGNTLMQNVPVGSISKKNSHLMSGPGGMKTENDKEVLGNDIISCSAKIGEKISSRTSPTDLGAGVSPTNSSVGKSLDGELVDAKSNHPTKSENVPSSYIIHPQALGSALDGNQVKLPSDEASSQKSYFVKVRNLNQSHAVETWNNKSKQLNEQEVIQDNLAETLTARTGITEQDRSSTDGFRAVNWIGGAIQISDEKTYYQSCCINGLVYEVKDYVLIRFDNDKLIPSKLQAMWEDNNTRMKWVTVNRCYFPGDLPKGVGRPCGLESSEVYESNRLSTIMAAFMQCPCEVLPPRKFAEEIERRTHLRMQSKDQLEPLYLCKWLYDESKGLFRDISC